MAADRRRYARALLPGLALVGAAAALMLGVAPASASSYGGTGDWVVSAPESVTGETIVVSGNLTVNAGLTLVNTTLTVDRNVTLTRGLSLINSSLTFTADGPGTNFLTASSVASLYLGDYDGLPETTTDGSLLAANAYGFNSTFASGSWLLITNSRVHLAGWSDGTTVRAGFDALDARVAITHSRFTGGFEALTLRYQGVPAYPAMVNNTTFDGSVSALNITGGANHGFRNLTFLNYTFGLRVTNSWFTTADLIFASSGVAVPFDAPRAPPPGTAVAFESSGSSTVTNLTLQGLPGASPPRLLVGFVARNVTGLEVRHFTGAWGEFPGQLFNASEVLLEDFDLASFTFPLNAVACTNVTVETAVMTGENTALQFGSTSGLAVRHLRADSLLIVALTSLGATGAFAFQDSTVSNAPGAAVLGGNASSPQFTNLTLTDLTFGLQLAVPDPTGARFEAIVATLLVQNVVDITFGNASGLSFVDFYTSEVSGIVANLTGTGLNHSTFARMDINGSDGDVLHLNVTNLHNISAAALAANLHFGALVHIETSSAVDVDLVNLLSTNSTGIIALLSGGTLDRVRASNITLIAGDQPPSAGPPASIVLDSTGQFGARPAGSVTGASLTGFRVNVSNRGGLFVDAGQGGSLLADNLTFESIQFEGVRVIARAGAMTATVRDVYHNGSGPAAVRLEGLAGGIVERLLATSATAVQLDGSTNVSARSVTHTGTYAGLLVTGGGQVSARGIDSVGNFAVDASYCDGLDLRNLTGSAEGFAVRSLYGSRLVVDGVDMAAANGIAVLGTSGAELRNVSLEVRGLGLMVGQGAADVTAVSLRLTSPAGWTSDTAAHITLSDRVRLTDFEFAGTCKQGALVQRSNSVDLLGFRAATCGRGVEVSIVRYLNITGLEVAGAYNGSGLVIANSQDLRVAGADLSRAASVGLLLSAIDRAHLSAIDASAAGSDGGLIGFAANTTVDGLVLDGAAGACMRILYASRNVTLANVSASRGLAGIEVISSANLSLSGVNASDNGGIGVYVDVLSTSVTLRNITAARNYWNGVLVTLNGTRLIDGNFTMNGEAGIGVAPSVRLDWRVEGRASLTDEAIDLTGDLFLGPGASLTATRSNITVEQTARRRALEPFASVTLSAGASLTLDRSTLAPRDARVPYSVVAGAGARLVMRSAELLGGGTTDSTSSVNLTGAEFHGADATFSNWFLPLFLTGGLLDCDACTFTQNRMGAKGVGANASLRSLYARDNDFDGLSLASATLVTLEAATVEYNHGWGARFSDIGYLQLTELAFLANDGGGIEVARSNLTGVKIGTNGSGTTGLAVLGPGTAAVTGLHATLNAQSGASFEDLAQVDLRSVEIHDNQGSGLRLTRVQSASVGGGRVSGSALYGLHAEDVGWAAVEGVEFSGDEGGAVRSEGTSGLSIGNASVSSPADYAATFFGSSRAILTSLFLTGNRTGVLATQSAEVEVLNSTMGEPTVVDRAVVTISWYLRVLVEDAGGFPADGVTVTVTNATGAVVGNATTAPGGAAPLIRVPERALRAGGAETFFGPQEVNASHPTKGRDRALLNVTRYRSLLMTLDDAAPLTDLSVEGQAGPTSWYLSEVVVNLRATDDREGGVIVFWRLEQGPWHAAVGQGKIAEARFTLSAEGQTGIEFYAEDGVGNAGAVESRTIAIDLSPPTARIAIDPTGTAVSNTGTLQLSWSGTDTGSGVAWFQVDYSVGGSPWIEWLTASPARLNGTFQATDGTYEFRVVALDHAQRSSAPAVLSVRVALYGSLRLRVVDPAGNFVENLTVEASTLGAPLNGSGIVNVTGLPPGPVTLRLTAPGFEPKVIEAAVTPGQTSELGDITMTPARPPGGGLDLSLAYLALGAVALLAVAYQFNSRRKWEQRKKEREAEDAARRKEEKTRRRRGLKP